MGEGPVQQKALIGPEDTTRFTGGFDKTTDFSDLGQFERWIQTVESASLYDMNIEANAGDTYITLITCRESSSVNERFIVVARESGEK